MKVMTINNDSKKLNHLVEDVKSGNLGRRDFLRRVVRAAILGEDPGDLSSIGNPETIQPIADLQKEKP